MLNNYYDDDNYALYCQVDLRIVVVAVYFELHIL